MVYMPERDFSPFRKDITKDLDDVYSRLYQSSKVESKTIAKIKYNTTLMVGNTFITWNIVVVRVEC